MPIVLEILDRLYPPESWADRVVRWINHCLIQGDKPSLEIIANKLAISPRQLQNKLKEDGCVFQALLDKVRKETALKYLNESQTSICDIAFLLGYSEQSAFNHAFKRWTGGQPGEYRRSRVLNV